FPVGGSTLNLWGERPNILESLRGRMCAAQLQPTVNDLTFQAATVNGSGSQTANLVVTRAIFSMGIPVAPKNVFPSNIEGLPTWYQLRITPEAYQARKNKVDVLVALNPTTWTSDLKNVSPGGAVVHEEAYSMAGARDHVTYYPV